MVITSLIPKPSSSFPSLAVQYCKYGIASDGKVGGGLGTRLVITILGSTSVVPRSWVWAQDYGMVQIQYLFK